MRLTYNEIAAHLGLSALEGDIVLTVAVTDSREAAPGALFVCIPGSRVDGHDFVPAAVALGASAVLASRPLPQAGVPVLLPGERISRAVLDWCLAGKQQGLYLSGPQDGRFETIQVVDEA